MKKASNPKIIAVIGPTASGKTSLAIKLAKKFKGELINADSRQIYKYLDIGTAKGKVSQYPITNYQLSNNNQYPITNIQTLDVYKLEGVPIHLINIVEPDKVLTLAQYQRLANAATNNILKRGKLPILVGGTGLYVDAIVKGYEIPKVKPDKQLRKQLSSKTVKQLQKRLIELNEDRFDRLNRSDKFNPRRLVRFIEIEKSRKDIRYKKSKKPPFDVLFLTPFYTRDILYKRINKRVKIIVKSGLIDEVKGLIKKGYSFSKPAMTATSYPIVKQYLDGAITKQELLEKFAQGDRNYARRQITWFRRYQAVFIKDDVQAFKEVLKFLKN